MSDDIPAGSIVLWPARILGRGSQERIGTQLLDPEKARHRDLDLCRRRVR